MRARSSSAGLAAKEGSSRLFRFGGSDFTPRRRSRVWITTAVGAARMSAQAIPAYERGLAVRAWADDFLRQHPPPSTLRRQYSLWLDETFAALGRLAYAVRTPPEPSTLRVGIWGAFARQNEDICRRLLPRLQSHAEAVQDPMCRGIARSLSDSLDGHP